MRPGRNGYSAKRAIESDRHGEAPQILRLTAFFESLRRIVAKSIIHQTVDYANSARIGEVDNPPNSRLRQFCENRATTRTYFESYARQRRPAPAFLQLPVPSLAAFDPPASFLAGEDTR